MISVVRDSTMEYTRRATPATRVLYRISEKRKRCLGGASQRQTHKRPEPKTATMASLFFNVMFNRITRIVGSAQISKSEMMLIPAGAM